jgi:hypothetical protein
LSTTFITNCSQSVSACPSAEGNKFFSCQIAYHSKKNFTGGTAFTHHTTFTHGMITAHSDGFFTVVVLKVKLTVLLVYPSSCFTIISGDAFFVFRSIYDTTLKRYYTRLFYKQNFTSSSGLTNNITTQLSQGLRIS